MICCLLVSNTWSSHLGAILTGVVPWTGIPLLREKQTQQYRTHVKILTIKASWNLQGFKLYHSLWTALSKCFLCFEFPIRTGHLLKNKYIKISHDSKMVCSSHAHYNPWNLSTNRLTELLIEIENTFKVI